VREKCRFCGGASDENRCFLPRQAWNDHPCPQGTSHTRKTKQNNCLLCRRGEWQAELLSEAALSKAMLEMDPDGEGVRVGVAAFAAWWEQKHSEAESGGGVSAGCLGGWGMLAVAAGAVAAAVLAVGSRGKLNR
jgi:hypothetical protein